MTTFPRLLRKLVFLLLAAGLPLAALAQGVGIGTATPDASAALDIRATGQGVLLPRLTQAQRLAIASPATGLLVYQTNGAQPGFWYTSGPPASPGWTFFNPTADNLGNHTAQQNLNLQSFALVGTGASIGTAVGVGIRADGGLNLGQNTTGNNLYLGYLAGQSNTTGYDNQFSGYQSGFNNTTGSSNQFSGFYSGQANTTGQGNLFVGFQSGYLNTTGFNNVFSGLYSGFTNTTGRYNTALGFQSGPVSGSNGLANTTALGANATVNASNTIQLGNGAIAALRCQVGLTVTSDARFKYAVRPDVPGLAFVTRLRPVTYRFDQAKLAAFERTGALPPGFGPPDPRAPLRSGFLAQDVEAAAHALGYAFDGVHAPANARDHYGLDYAQFVVPLVQAVQEQQAQIAALQAQNAADHAALFSLQAQVARLAGAAPAPAPEARAQR